MLKTKPISQMVKRISNQGRFRKSLPQICLGSLFNSLRGALRSTCLGGSHCCLNYRSCIQPNQAWAKLGTERKQKLSNIKNQIKYFTLTEILVLKTVKSRLSKSTKMDVDKLVSRKERRNCFMLIPPSYFPWLSKLRSSSNSFRKELEERVFDNRPLNGRCDASRNPKPQLPDTHLLRSRLYTAFHAPCGHFLKSPFLLSEPRLSAKFGASSDCLVPAFPWYGQRSSG